MSTRVTENPTKSRFEIFDGDELAGFVTYRHSPDGLALVHTEVDDRFAGRGLGSVLVKAALDAVREQGHPVLPECPFVRSWIARHSDYKDLVPAAQHARFGL